MEGKFNKSVQQLAETEKDFGGYFELTGLPLFSDEIDGLNNFLEQLTL